MATESAFDKTFAGAVSFCQALIKPTSALLASPTSLPIMDTIFLCALQRACQQLSADNEAVIDWADDTAFRLLVSRRELKAAVENSQRDCSDCPHVFGRS